MSAAAARISELRASHRAFLLGPVSVDLAPGEVLVVLGMSGSGKTTLLRCLAGLHPVDGGLLAWGGRDVTQAPPEVRSVGYVPQGLSLFPHRTVQENVGYAPALGGSSAPTKPVAPLLARFGLEELRHRRPHQLSWGQKQRVAMARALAARPQLLLWDEPLSALDVLSRDDLLRMVADVAEEERTPFVLVTHDPAVAGSIGDRFLLLERGAARFLGSPERFFASPPDAFAARFAGFENVLTPDDLRRAEGEPWARWWRQRAGPEGLCFAAEQLRATDRTEQGSLPAVVRNLHREPTRWRVGLECGPWRLEQYLPLETARPELGVRVQVAVDETFVRPLG